MSPSRRAVLGATMGTAVVTAAAVAGWPAQDAEAAPRGLVDRGAWNSRTTYGLGDRVSGHGTSWVAVRSSTGLDPVRSGGRWVRAA
jgi:hypothetical protein